MELLRHKHLKKAHVQVVNLCLILVVIIGMTGCRTVKDRYTDCRGYEQRHYSVKQSSGIHVHGKIRVCDTRKLVPLAKITFVSDSGAVYETTANNKGYYEIRLPWPYFVGKVVAAGSSARFTVEDVFFGHTNTCELNINLYNYNNKYNMVELLKNDIIWIRENSKKKNTADK